MSLSSHWDMRSFQWPYDAGMFTVKGILQGVLDRNLSLGQTADIFSITPRRCSHLMKLYRQSGLLGMNNQSRGRPGNRLLPTSLTNQDLSIIWGFYSNFGPTLAREKISENHGFVLGKQTLRRLMIKSELWVRCKQLPPKIL